MSDPIASPLEADPIPNPPAGDPIFTPLKFRNLEVKNRIFRSSISGRWDNEDGSLSQTRVNWEAKFARGGVGAIISSFVPVLLEGRIAANYGTVHRDDFIPMWEVVGKAVHKWKCKFIMQLSHSGRQMDVPGVSNQHRPTLSSTSRKESLHGFLCKAATKGDIADLIEAFAKAAWRAREAGLDGVELHAANGYLFTQFLSSGINDRTDDYGGSLENRARFLLEVIRAIRATVGREFHLQVKLSAYRPQQCHPLGRQGQLARRHHQGRAVVRAGNRRRDPCVERLAVSASAQPARRFLVRDDRDDLRRDDLLGRRHVP